MAECTIIPYSELREGPSIVFEPGEVAVPPEIPKLEMNDLPLEMKKVIAIAYQIYQKWLISINIIDDEQPRLLLVFSANIPEKAMTLRANLAKLGQELAAGLNLNVLTEALNVLK